MGLESPNHTFATKNSRNCHELEIMFIITIWIIDVITIFSPKGNIAGEYDISLEYLKLLVPSQYTSSPSSFVVPQ